jgi:hypothetical protein
MSEVCSLYKRGFIECGPSRGRTETVFLYECRDDISVHLKSCCLSRSNLKEYEVILQRAGLDGTSLNEVKKLRVCARHRYGLGRYWRASRSCQYPRHGGSSTKAKGRDVINVTMAKEIYQLFGIHVSIGSRKKCLILLSYLYKMRFLFAM